jgi:hypothetical protein
MRNKMVFKHDGGVLSERIPQFINLGISTAIYQCIEWKYINCVLSSEIFFYAYYKNTSSL